MAAAALAAVLVLTLVLAAAHQWSEDQGEDAAPVWSCHTMCNGRCGPDAPWHGVVIRR